MPLIDDYAIALSSDIADLNHTADKGSFSAGSVTAALFLEQFAGPRWAALASRGAQVQRPLWASTGTKNPAYSDVKYVETLIGPNTVNTLPPATLDAFRDHGTVARTVDADIDGARRALGAIGAQGISLSEVTDKLLAEGLASFQKSFDTLIAGLAGKAAALGRPFTT